MSKSFGNYIALEDVPKDMFGKLMSISDDRCSDTMSCLTTEDLIWVKAAHPMEAKQQLAVLIVARYHGEEPARKRGRVSAEISRPGISERLGCPLDRLDPGRSARRATISLVDLVTKTGLVPSKSEARRLIIQGGLEVDEQKQSDANALIPIVAGRAYRLRVGRRKFALVELRP